jgi:hypothetical protein
MEKGVAGTRRKDRHNRPHHIVLNSEDVVKLPVISLGPSMGTGGSIDELRCDADTLAAPLDASFQQVACAKLSPDLPDIDRLALVLEA